MAELRPNMTPYFGVYKSLFKFGGLPAPLTPDALVSLFFYNEYIAFTNLGDKVVAGAITQTSLNLYGEPGDEVYISFEANHPGVYRKKDQFVRLDMSIGDHETPYKAIYKAAQIVEEIDLAIKLNVKAHQIPVLWGVTSKEMKEEILRLLDKVRTNVTEPVIIDGTSVLAKDGIVHAINPNVPYIVANLQAAKAQAKSELYALIGVNYAALQKVSNAVVDEVNANEVVSGVVFDQMLDRLKEAFQAVNTMFKVNMTVEARFGLKRSENGQNNHSTPNPNPEGGNPDGNLHA